MKNQRDEGPQRPQAGALGGRGQVGSRGTGGQHEAEHPGANSEVETKQLGTESLRLAALGRAEAGGHQKIRLEVRAGC